MKKQKEKKSFYPVRHFRISNKNYNKLLNKKKILKGTWNYTFTKLLN